MTQVTWQAPVGVLNARLRQNTVQEKLAGLWLDRLLDAHPLEHV